MKDIRALGWAVSLGCGLAAVGCVADLGGTDEEELGRITQGVQTPYPVKTDASKKVEVKIWRCDPSASSTDPETECFVPNDSEGWLMIGGGAEIVGEPSQGSPVLKASRPGYGFDTNSWIARSHGSNAHQLRAWVIGLRLQGLTKALLLPQRFIHDNTGPGTRSLSPETSGEVLVGGGAEVLLPTDLGYLIESAPVGTNTWRATINSGAAQVKVLTISLNRCPTGVTYCLDSYVYSATSAVSTAYGNALIMPATTAWAVTGIGGLASQSAGAGKRYLHDLLPLTSASTGTHVRTKNVGIGNGTSTAYALGVMVSGAPYQYNTVGFTAAGYFYRGTNGRLQNFSSPGGLSHIWSLDPILPNVYRLRNSNPGSLGECAYWPGGTNTTVSIGSCSGAAAQWELVSGSLTGTFQLKNQAAGMCIDRNGFGLSTTTPRDVALKTCEVGLTNQPVFLDRYTWPW